MNRNCIFAREPNPVELSYIAAILDWSGYIHMAFPSKSNNHIQVALRVAYVDDSEIIKVLKEIMGDPTTSCKHKLPGGIVKSNNSSFSWNITGKRLDHLLTIILPYIRYRNKEFSLLKELRSTFRNGSNSVASHIIEKRLKIAHKIKDLVHERKTRCKS